MSASSQLCALIGETGSTWLQKSLRTASVSPSYPGFRHPSPGATKMTESPLLRKVWSALEPPMVWA